MRPCPDISKFRWLGGIALFMVAVDIFVNFGDWTELFWFCPVATSLLAWALFARSSLLMSVCLILAVPAQVPWIVDFILQQVGHGMGRTAMLEPCGPFIFWGSAVIHSFAVPVSLWGVVRLGFHRGALPWAMGFGAALLTVTFAVTPAFKNVNCVFFPCDADDPGGGYQRYFMMYVIPLWAVIVPLSYAAFRVVFRNNHNNLGSRAECQQARSRV